jgi:ribonucleoside-diphosphate reductase alpha chain
MDAFSIAVSVGLQYGVPLEDYVSKFINSRFEPSGMTNDPDIRFASSLMDYIFRRLALEYLSPERRAELGIHSIAERKEYAKEYGNGTAGSGGSEPGPTESSSLTEGVPGAGPGPRLIDLEEARKPSSSPGARILDAPLCYACGAKMQPAGSCYVCTGCGSTSGCS